MYVLYWGISPAPQLEYYSFLWVYFLQCSDFNQYNFLFTIQTNLNLTAKCFILQNFTYYKHYFTIFIKYFIVLILRSNFFFSDKSNQNKTENYIQYNNSFNTKKCERTKELAMLQPKQAFKRILFPREIAEHYHIYNFASWFLSL